MPGSGAAGPYADLRPSILSSPWPHQLTAPPTVQDGSLSPHPLLHSLLLEFLMKAIWTGLKSCLIVILTCISLIISHVEPLFTGLVAFCISSLGKCLFRFSAHFGWSCLFIFLILSCMSYLSTLDIKPLH